MSKTKSLSVIWLEGGKLEIKKYLEKFIKKPPRFTKLICMVMAVMLVMIVGWIRADKEKIIKDCKIMRQIIEKVTQESLRSPYLKTSEEENGE